MSNTYTSYEIFADFPPFFSMIVDWIQIGIKLRIYYLLYRKLMMQDDQKSLERSW